MVYFCNYLIFDNSEKINEVCTQYKLYLHLDGARLFNALTESKQTPKDYGKLFDTISICLSKGLGAPAGSVLISNKENIKMARRVRKVLGGAMRQSGYLAAAGIYALDHHVKRMKDDHQRAKIIGKTLESCSFVEYMLPVETNIVIFGLNKKYDDDTFLRILNEKGILAVQMDRRLMRFVTHLDFDDAMLEKVVKTIVKM